MTQQQIMGRAHQIARTCEGDYAARLALGLRQAWLEFRLVKLGTEWRKNSLHRVYFNNIARWYGLELDHYKTRRIAAATLNGEHISNTQAGKIDGRLCMAKIYYDFADGRFHGTSLSRDDFDTIVANIKAA